MKKIIFITTFVFISSYVMGMGKSPNDQDHKKSIITKYDIGDKKRESVSPVPSVAPNTNEHADVRSRSAVIQEDIPSGQTEETLCPPNCLASFSSEKMQDIATVLLSFRNIIRKQNFMHRSELKQVKSKARTQEKSEIHRQYQEAQQMSDKQLDDRLHQLTQNVQYQQEIQRKLLQKESKLRQQLKQNEFKIQQVLRDFQNLKSQYPQEFEQKLNQRQPLQKTQESERKSEQILRGQPEQQQNKESEKSGDPNKRKSPSPNLSKSAKRQKINDLPSDCEKSRPSPGRSRSRYS